MTEVVIKDLETGIRDLFRRAYLSNCELEGEELTEVDRQTLEDLDPLEILENFKDLVESLLNCKRDFKKSDKSEIAGRCEQFESMLQKLEAEVRTHIRIEQQLKLHSDALQAKLEENETNTAASDKEQRKSQDDQHVRKQSLSTIELLSAEKEGAVEQSHRRVLSMERDAATSCELRSDSKAQKLYELAEQRHKSLLKLEKECISLRIAYDKRCVELEKSKQDYERVLRELQLYRIKKTQELISRKKSDERSLMKLGRASPERPLTDRQVRKSVEVDRKQEQGAAYKYSENSYNSRSKLDSTPQSHHVDIRRKAHTRTVSERVKRPVTSVRSRPKV